MTKNRRKHVKRSLSPFIFFAGGLLLLVLAVFMFSGSADQGGGTPAISVDKPVIDYGYVKLNTDLTFTITVTNKGDGVLRFAEAPYIEIKEGC